MKSILLVALLFTFTSSRSFGENSRHKTDEALWEYGFGIGYTRLEHYPASSEQYHLTAGFPTFEYRGEILRADDRDGARAFLFKGEKSAIEFSGALFPMLRSDDDSLRAGMPDIPWAIAIGPQFVYQLSPDIDFKIGTFQVITTDFSRTHLSGYLGQLKLVSSKKWEMAEGHLLPAFETTSKFSWTLKGGDSQFLGLYFDVHQENVKPNRLAYESNPGFLGQELSFLQSAKSGRTSLYAGISVSDDSGSANRKSSLHQNDLNWTGLIGLTYILGESSRDAVPIEDTTDLIHKIKKYRSDQPL